MAEPRAAVLRTGLVTPVGLGSAQSSLAIRAGVPGFGETAVYDRHFQPFVMALFPDEELPELDDSLADARPGLTARQSRMLRLAALALEETLDGVPTPDGIPLFLAGPEPMAGDFLSQVALQAGVELDLAASRTFPDGRAGGLLALEAALALIDSGQKKRVLVGGVDTYLDLYLLGTLDQQGRIKSDHAMDGLIPGESAAFLLLGDPKRDDGEPLANVVGVATAEELGHRGSEEPYRGDGLSNAFTTLLDSSANGELVQTVLGDLTGESLGVKEWGVAFLRNHPRFHEDHALEHPAEYVGDTGAAAGPLLLALAALGLHDKSVDGPCLVWCSSDGPTRGAAFLDSAHTGD